MIKISEELKTRFKQDSVPKDIIIRVQDNVIEPITKKNTLSQQVTLTESICEEEQLTFGGCNASQFEFTAINMDADIKGYELSPYLLVDGVELPLGIFIVNNIEKIAGKTHRKITAYDRMQLFDRDVREWYGSFTFPIKIKNFRDSLCAYVGIEQNEATLPIDDIEIERTLDDSQEINGLQLMKSICEMSGCFGRMDRYGKFDYLFLSASTLLPDEELYPSEDLYPSDASESGNYLQIENNITKEFPKVDDNFTEYITGVTIIDTDGAEYKSDDQDNLYYITDNFIAYGKTQEELKQLADLFLEYTSCVSYRPVQSIKIVGQPYAECGDFITTEVNGYGIESYIFKRTMTGVYSLTDVYEAKGRQYLEHDTNGIIGTLQRLSGNVGKVNTRVEKTENGLLAEVERATEEEGKLASQIELTSAEIVLKVDANGKIVQVALRGDAEKGTEFKVNADNINLSASDVINLLANGNINLTGKNITITSDNFSVSKEGNVTAKNMNITGGNIRIEVNGDGTGSTISDGYLELISHNIPVGIGGNLGTEKLKIGSHGIIMESGDWYCGISSIGFSFGINGSQPYVYLDDLGNLITGLISCTQLYASGDVTCKSVIQTSDKELKKDIESLGAESSDFIYSLRPVKYRFKENQSERYHHGFIAQEVKESMGEDDWGLYVDKNLETGESGGKALRYEELIADLIATVQSQNERIKALESQIGGNS